MSPTKLPQNVLLASALKYALVLGWPVFPLRGKHPLTKHGSKDATLDEQQIREWWKKWPWANIGIATGLKFWAFDVDTKHGGDLSLEELEHKYGQPLPDTIRQLTPTGGRHYLFGLPDDFEVHNSESVIAPGIDVRGVGGYIVAAPSIHPDNGKTYVWDGLEKLERQLILPAPDWLLAAVRKSQRKGRAAPLLTKIPNGKRRSALLSIAGTMRNRGLEVNEIFAALKVINEERCTEPAPIKDVHEIAESVCRYPVGKILPDGDSIAPPDSRSQQQPHAPEPDPASEPQPVSVTSAPPGPAPSPLVTEFDLPAWLSKHGIKTTGPLPFPGGGTTYPVACPWNYDHVEAAVTVMTNGALVFKCFDPACIGYTWQHFRECFEGARPSTAGAPKAPASPPTGKPTYNMAAFIAHHHLNARPPVRYGTGGGLKWVLEECPFDPQHQGGAALFLRGSGRPGFKCSGDGCAGRHWRDLLRLLEPPAAQASGFRLEDDGVYFETGEPGEPAVHVSGPLEIVACTRDRRSENWGRLMRSVDADGCVHEWAMPMSLLAGDGTAYREELHHQGLYVATGRRARGLLAAYIQSSLPAERIRCTDHIGWDGGIYVLPDTAIGPAGAENLLYQATQHTEHFYGVSGTLSGWQSGIAAPCSGNSRLIFSVSAAFAGPLLAWLEVEGGGVHLVGSTSEGKTTVLLAAGSVLGGGGPRGFVRTWRSTANGLEAIAELHNDNLLLLDELRELSDPREADSIAYMLSNGAGKARMTRTITARRSLQWRLLFLSSGEIRLSEYAASVGRRTKGGAEVRLLNIPAEAGAGMGAFENLHGADSAAIFADQLMAAAKKHYGHALRAFLTKLVVNRGQYLDQAHHTMEDFVRTFRPPDASPEVGRALRRFGVVAAAGELASSLGITGWPQGTAWWGAGRCFEAWLADRGGTGAFDSESAVSQVRAFLALNGASRFQPVTHRFDRNQNEIVEKVINRAGFWRGTKSTREYLIFPEIFKKEVCAGFDYRAVAAELEKRGWLKRSRPHWTKKARGAPEGSRFFCVRGTILNE